MARRSWPTPRVWRGRVAVVLGIFCLAATIAWPPRPILVWNASASAPLGLYAVSPVGPVRVGDMVIARTPQSVRDLAARRHYLPANVPLVKRVAAVGGDRVCARGDSVSVNGIARVHRVEHDGAGRPLPWWRGCTVLGHGALFLLMANRTDSFDGRYFGATGPDDVIGKAHLLWPG